MTHREYVDDSLLRIRFNVDTGGVAPIPFPGELTVPKEYTPTFEVNGFRFSPSIVRIKSDAAMHFISGRYISEPIAVRVTSPFKIWERAGLPDKLGEEVEAVLRVKRRILIHGRFLPVSLMTDFTLFDELCGEFNYQGRGAGTG